MKKYNVPADRRFSSKNVATSQRHIARRSTYESWPTTDTTARAKVEPGTPPEYAAPLAKLRFTPKRETSPDSTAVHLFVSARFHLLPCNSVPTPTLPMTRKSIRCVRKFLPFDSTRPKITLFRLRHVYQIADEYRGHCNDASVKTFVSCVDYSCAQSDRHTKVNENCLDP